MKKLAMVMATVMMLSVVGTSVFAETRGRADQEEWKRALEARKEADKKLKEQRKDALENLRDKRQDEKEDYREGVKDSVYKGVYAEVYREQLKDRLEQLRDRMKVVKHLAKDKRKDLMKESIALRKQMNDKSTPVFVNGVDLKFDVPPVIKDGRTLIPVRAVAEALGAEVKWDEKARTITVTASVYKDAYGKPTTTPQTVVIVLKLDSRTVTVNGVSSPIEVPAKSYSGRVMVPMRLIAEALKKKVEWDNELGSAVVED